jgi:hypothetical protein
MLRFILNFLPKRDLSEFQFFFNSKLSKLHAQMFRLKENFNKTNKIQRVTKKNLHIGDFDEQKYRTKKN